MRASVGLTWSGMGWGDGGSDKGKQMEGAMSKVWQELDIGEFASLDFLNSHLASAAHAGKFELLVGVGGVVRPFPGDNVDGNDQVLDGEGDVHLSDLLEVILDEVGVLHLRETVVVAVVVLDVPGLGHHPVEPVVEAVPEGTHSELEAVPAVLLGVDLDRWGVRGVGGKGGVGGGNSRGEFQNLVKQLVSPFSQSASPYHTPRGRCGARSWSTWRRSTC